jgi:hypothetical protein
MDSRECRFKKMDCASLAKRQNPGKQSPFKWGGVDLIFGLFSRIEQRMLQGRALSESSAHVPYHELFHF